MEELQKISPEDKEKIETTLNSRVRKLSVDVQEIKTKTNNLILNNSPHGMATLSTSLFVLASQYYALGDYKSMILCVAGGLFAYAIQNILTILKIKIADGNIADIAKSNMLVRKIGEMTGYYDSRK